MTVALKKLAFHARKTRCIYTPWIILADAFGAKGHADQVKKDGLYDLVTTWRRHLELNMY